MPPITKHALHQKSTFPARRLVGPRPWAPLLLVLLNLAAVDAWADDSATTPRLVATSDLLAWVDGAVVRIYDHKGRVVARFSPTPSDEARAAPDANTFRIGVARDAKAARAHAAAERILDDLDLSGGDREDDEAADFVDDELSTRERGRGREDLGGAEPRDQTNRAQDAWATGDGAALIIGAQGGVWRIRAGRAPERLGAVPAGVKAAAVVAGGWLVVATDAALLASQDGRRFVQFDGGRAPPQGLVADPHAPWVGLRFSDRLEVVRLETAMGVGSTRLSSSTAPTIAERLVYETSAPVRDVAICGGNLVALTDDGLFMRAPKADRDGGFVPLDLGANGGGIACTADSATAIAVFGPGLRFSPFPGVRPPTQASNLPIPDVTAAARVADSVFVITTSRRLLRITPTGEILILDQQASPIARRGGTRPPASVAASPVAAPGAPRPKPGWSAALLPELAIVGRLAAQPQRRRSVGLAVVANWRLGGGGGGGPVGGVHSAGIGGDDGAALAQFASAPPGLANANGLPAAAPADAGMPYLGPDHDAACLPATRQRAVALAAAEPEAAQSLVVRAGRSAWLPELRLRAERRLGRSESLDFKPAAANDALGLDAVSDVRYEVRAIWDLPRLVFNPEELGAHQQAARIADMRREIESQVNRLYFERRRLLAIPAAASADEAATWQIRLEEIEADLDALSGGAFARCRAGLSQPRPARS